MLAILKTNLKDGKIGCLRHHMGRKLPESVANTCVDFCHNDRLCKLIGPRVEDTLSLVVYK